MTKKIKIITIISAIAISTIAVITTVVMVFLPSNGKDNGKGGNIPISGKNFTITDPKKFVPATLLDPLMFVYDKSNEIPDNIFKLKKVHVTGFLEPSYTKDSSKKPDIPVHFIIDGEIGLHSVIGQEIGGIEIPGPTKADNVALQLSIAEVKISTIEEKTIMLYCRNNVGDLAVYKCVLNSLKLTFSY